MSPELVTNTTNTLLSKYTPLYYIGNVGLLNSPCFTIVGSRKITSYGKQVTSDLCKHFASFGITTVSGYVDGVDIEVFKNTLLNKGKTIICLGYGFNYFDYKKFNLLCEKAGVNKPLENVLILSQFENTQNATKWTFPKRDELLSSVSRGVVVVEASEKSGTFYTVKKAFKENKKVFCVPGNIYSPQSKGVHRIIAGGLTGGRGILYYDFTQIKKYLKIEDPNSVQSKKIAYNLSGEEQALLQHLSPVPIDFDDLLKLTKLSADDQNVLLAKLELKGIITRTNNSLYNIVL